MADNTERHTQLSSDNSYNRMDINVRVNDTMISLNIDRSEEQSIRAAASEVNRIFSLYRDRYSASTDDKELMTYTALHFATVVAEMQIDREDLALKGRLDQLKERLATALYPHREEPKEADRRP